MVGVDGVLWIFWPPSRFIFSILNLFADFFLECFGKGVDTMRVLGMGRGRLRDGGVGRLIMMARDKGGLSFLGG